MGDKRRVSGDGGQAKSTKKNVEIVLKLLNDRPFWEENTPESKLTGPFATLTKEELFQKGKDLIEDFANYLLYAHKARGGKPYSAGSISNYISTAYRQMWLHPSMQPVREGPKYKTPSFFLYARHRGTGSGGSTGLESHRILLSLKANAEKARRKMDQVEGRGDGKGAPPVSLGQMKRISEVFAREGSQKAAENIVATIAGWISTGRGGESGFLSFHTLKRHPILQQYEVVLSEAKRGKTKLVAIMSGACRYMCPFTALGTSWMFPPTSEITSDDVPWMIPGQPTTTQLSNILKSALPPKKGTSSSSLSSSSSSPSSPSRRRSSRFHRFAIDVGLGDLPSNLSAGSLRHGTLDELVTQAPLDYVVMASGHWSEMTNDALWEYISPSISKLQPAAVVLHGWSKFPWGQNGRGSVPASFEALSEFSTKEEKVHEFVSELLHLPFRFPILRRHETLYPFSMECAAHVVMWYNERDAANEFSQCSLHMQHCYAKIFEPSMSVDLGALVVAHKALKKWSAKIHAHWTIRNAHMTARARAQSSNATNDATVVALVEAHEE